MYLFMGLLLRVLWTAGNIGAWYRFTTVKELATCTGIELFLVYSMSALD